MCMFFCGFLACSSLAPCCWVGNKNTHSHCVFSAQTDFAVCNLQNDTHKKMTNTAMILVIFVYYGCCFMAISYSRHDRKRLIHERGMRICERFRHRK